MSQQSSAKQRALQQHHQTLAQHQAIQAKPKRVSNRPASGGIQHKVSPQQLGLQHQQAVSLQQLALQEHQQTRAHHKTIQAKKSPIGPIQPKSPTQSVLRSQYRQAVTDHAIQFAEQTARNGHLPRIVQPPGTIQPMFGWLGSYVGDSGAYLGGAVDQAIDVGASYYLASAASSYLGVSTENTSYAMRGLYTVAASILINSLTAFGKRLWRATMKRLTGPSEYELGLVSWCDGKFSDAIGHTSVALVQNGNIVGIWGLSPDPLPSDIGLVTVKRLCKPGNGKIYDDKDMLDDHTAYIELFGVSKHQYMIADKTIRASEKNAPKYSLLGFGGSSCATWAIMVLRSAGVTGGSALARYLMSLPREIGFESHKPLTKLEDI